MAQEIVIDIDPDGRVTVEGHGIIGPDCKTLTADIERALGTVEKTTLKPEYRTRKSGTHTVKR